MTDLRRRARRGKVTAQCFQLAAMLAAGQALDRKSVANALKTSPANADRYLRAIIDKMEVSVGQRDRMKLVRARSNSSSPTTDLDTAAAACIAASLAQLFQSTKLGARMNEAIKRVLASAPDASIFENRERQFLFLTRGGERALNQKGSARLDVVIAAILGRHELRLKYKTFAGVEERCVMNPLSLALHEHQLYVLGYVRSELKTIRFSRISAAFRKRKTFKYPTLAAYDPRELFQHSLGIFSRDDASRGIRVCKVKIRLDGKWLHYVRSHRWHPSQQHRTDKRGLVLEMHVRTCEELDRLILGFGPDAEVLSPPHLRERIAQRAKAAGELYSRK